MTIKTRVNRLEDRRHKKAVQGLPPFYTFKRLAGLGDDSQPVYKCDQLPDRQFTKSDIDALRPADFPDDQIFAVIFDFAHYDDDRQNDPKYNQTLTQGE